MEEEKLNEMYQLTVENNKMLRSMRRNAMIGGVLKFIFWVFLLVVIPYYAWLYVQPYVQKIEGTYTTVQKQQQSFANFDIGKFFSQFGSTTGK